MKLFFFILLSFSLSVYSYQDHIDNKTDSITFYLKQSRFYIASNNYLKAIDFTQRAIDLSDSKKDSIQKSKSLATIGYIYFKLKRYDEAILGLQESIQNFSSKKSLSDKSSVYYLIGMCYIEKKNNTKADSYFELAEKIQLQINNPEAKQMLNLQRGIVYKSKGLLQKATNLFEGIISKSDIIVSNDTRAEAYFHLADIQFNSNKSDIAFQNLMVSLKLNELNTNLDQKSKILLKLSLVCDKIGRKAVSFEYMKQHLAIEKILSKIELDRQDNIDFNKFKDAKNKKEIEIKNKEIQDKLKTSKYSKLISILAIALISILSLLSLSLYKNNIIRNETNVLLKEKNAELIIAKENAERATRSRSDFLSTVSHELRTPLNAINGITHLLIEENPKKSQIEYLSSLKFSSNYLSTFINEILEVNRMESTIIIPEKIEFNIHELLLNIFNTLKEIATINNNQFIIDVDKNIPKSLVGDPTKISQIIINLINNSLKFTKNGSVKISAYQNFINNQYTLINFVVVDTGIGIPKDKLESVFESFSQGSIEINRKYGGTGLGLTIVKNLVEVLGGKITLESEVEKGTVFSFDLKFNIAKENTKIEKETILETTPLIGKKILLVEDNKINQMITKKMIENKQMKCEIIDNAEDAIESIRANHYDLVLMDVHLPGMNGTDATKIIRDFNPKIPIIALTAISLNENRKMLLEFGMNEVITKPFEPEKFYEIISKLI